MPMEKNVNPSEVVVPKKMDINEEISKARVERLLAEEAELEQKSEEIKELKSKTLFMVRQMEMAALEEDEELRRKIRNDIVVMNLRLVTAVLQKYGSWSQDKFQNGCIGLLKAADSFDSERGVPFHNFAAFCIETEIRAAFRRVNRAFEGKKQGFLDSLDAKKGNDGDKEQEGHDMIEDPFAEQEFDTFIDEAELDTLFYDIIIPAIEEYGTRSKDIDMELWKQLEIQYFIELSIEKSQRQRITFTEMAKQLGTVPQNLRVRHKKVLERVKSRCREYGYNVIVASNGRARMVRDFEDRRGLGDAVSKMNQKEKNRKK